MLVYVPTTAYVLFFCMPDYFFKDLIDMLSNFFLCNWTKYWRIKSVLYIELILICSILLCKISTVDLTGTTLDKSTVEILQNFVAFSEYTYEL